MAVSAYRLQNVGTSIGKEYRLGLNICSRISRRVLGVEVACVLKQQRNPDSSSGE